MPAALSTVTGVIHTSTPYPDSHTLASLSLRPLSSTHASIARILFALACLFILNTQAHAQKKRHAPLGAHAAVVVDERLAALRDAPGLSAPLLQRLSRGRAIAVNGPPRNVEGVSFYNVLVTRRTRGWLQAESFVAPWRAGDDEKLLRLIRGSEDFDRLSRARLFLDAFTRSPLRPAVLLIFGETAEAAAQKLSHEAARRLDEREMSAGGAPTHSYYLNYNGLDRYRKQGIVFTFDPTAKQFHYDGATWRELLRRYPRTPEALQARQHLDNLHPPPPH